MSGKCVSEKKVYVQINERGSKKFVKLYRSQSASVVHHRHCFTDTPLNTAPASLFREATPEEKMEFAALSL